jgi:hypothetical protein
MMVVENRILLDFYIIFNSHPWQKAYVLKSRADGKNLNGVILITLSSDKKIIKLHRL